MEGIISERRYDGHVVEINGRKGIELLNGNIVWLDTLLDDYIDPLFKRIGKPVRIVINEMDRVRDREDSNGSSH